MLCPYCKSEIPDDAKKCMNCAEWLDPAYRPTTREEQGFFSKLGECIFNLLWFLFVTAIIAIAVMLFLQAHENGIFDLLTK